MPTKIVGVRFYNGQVTIGERVLLVREPNNPYDRNAIQVKNVMGDQVGHIGRNVAAKLAPYMVRVLAQTTLVYVSLTALFRTPGTFLLRAC